MLNVKNNFDDLFRDPEKQGKIISIKKCIENYNNIHDDDQITEDKLINEILNQNLNNDLKILFKKYDKYENESLAGLKPNSKEKRNKLYELLELPKEVINLIEKIVPLIENNENLIILPGERVSDPWIHDVATDYYWWNIYKECLKKDLPQDVKDEVIADLDIATDKILDYLDPPDKEHPYKTRGIVVGHVQSGKTSNMQGLAAKAIDMGYKLVIILSGTNKILRSQTQRRFDKQLLGREVISPSINFDEDYILDPDEEYQGDEDFNEFISHGSSYRSVIPKIHRITTSKDNGLRTEKGRSSIRFQNHFEPERINKRENLDMNDAYFAAIMKNTSAIKRLKDEIKNTGLKEELQNVPILVIDDESDSASVNVASRKQDRDAVSATNREIRNLLDELPRAQYVAYTATPQANFFTNPDISQDIFPKDFAIALPTPPGYMGGKDFENEKYTRDIWLTDSDRNLETMKEAVDAFVLSGAIKLYRVDKQDIPMNLIKHHTMLVHESSNNAEQEETARALTREIWDKNDYDGGLGFNRLEKLYSEDFLQHSKSLEDEEVIAKKMPTFDELRPFIQKAILKIQSGGEIYRIVNQLYDEPDFSKESIWKIFIGGNKISRGYTIEGLTISYYTRPTTAGDTLQQMARWFGYRKNYKDLVRLYICRNAGSRRNRDLYHEFQGLTADEDRLRKRLFNAPDKKIAYEKDLTPVNWSYIVSAESNILPTRRSAMQDVELVVDNFARSNKEPEIFPAKSEKDRIKSNNELLFSFLSESNRDLKEVSFGINDENKIYNYLSAWSDPDEFQENFLSKFKMQGDKVDPWRYVKTYLKGEEIPTEIDKWLLLINKGDGSELYKHHPEEKIKIDFKGFELNAVKRSRKDKSKRTSHGGFVASVPEHRRFAEYLSYSNDLNPNPKTDLEKIKKRYGKKRLGVALIFIANFVELEPIHSIGFSLHFPDNKLPITPVFKFKKDRQSS